MLSLISTLFTLFILFALYTFCMNKQVRDFASFVYHFKPEEGEEEQMIDYFCFKG